MLGNHFYHEIIKKNVKAFGTIFNNIEIEKKDLQNLVKLRKNMEEEE